MKRISTLMAALCLFAITESAQAQTFTVSNTNPITSPTPAMNAPVDVTSGNGFTSTNNNTFNDFPKTKLVAITSPSYSYSTNQSNIYFLMNCSIAKTATYSTTVSLIYGSPENTLVLTSENINFVKGDVDYYFTIDPGFTLGANTNFKIKIEINVTDNTVKANTFATNASAPSAQAPLPLPVKFSSFEAKTVNAGVALTWKVGTEQNVNDYEVERSSDGRSFSKIGSVTATGQGAYTFTDSKPLASAYYRIKSADIDGRFGYSSVVSLKGGTSSIVLKAFPSPVQNELTIQHNTASENNRITISSVDGRLIQSVIAVPGSQQTKVDLSAAKTGLYLVRFDNGNGETETLKVIKQ